MPPPKDPPAAAAADVGESLDAVYDRYAPQVERWARRLAGPTLDIEDLLHDIFLVVVRRWPEFRGESKTSTWLFGITERVVRWRRRNDNLRRWLWLRHGQSMADISGAVPTPVEELERRQRQRLLYAALDRLPEKYRTPVILFSFEGLSGEQIAALLGTDTNTVWVRLHRGRAQLARLLADAKEPSP